MIAVTAIIVLSAVVLGALAIHELDDRCRRYERQIADLYRTIQEINERTP